MLDRIEDAITYIEDEVIVNTSRQMLNRMSDVRHDLLKVRKSVWLNRDVLSAIERGTSAYFSDRTRIYMRDVYDHITQSMDLVETYRDILASARDTYASTISNNLNEVMKKLTVIASIAGALTVIAGIYGMNFQYMPELYWEYGYPVILTIMIVIAGIMVVYFRWKKWI